MKTIIAGGRTFDNRSELIKAIESCGWKITEVVCGCAPGVDKMGAEWAIDNDIIVRSFPANWSLYGKAAGPKRNRQMAEYAEALVALWDYSSKGTRNMIEEATKRGLKVYVHRIDNQVAQNRF